MIWVSKRTRILGITLLASAALSFALGYKDYRRLEKERGEMGSAYEMLVASDLYRPRTSPLFKVAFLVFGATSITTVGSAIIDVGVQRKK